MGNPIKYNGVNLFNFKRVDNLIVNPDCKTILDKLTKKRYLEAYEQYRDELCVEIDALNSNPAISEFTKQSVYSSIFAIFDCIIGGTYIIVENSLDIIYTAEFAKFIQSNAKTKTFRSQYKLIFELGEHLFDKNYYYHINKDQTLRTIISDVINIGDRVVVIDGFENKKSNPFDCYDGIVNDFHFTANSWDGKIAIYNCETKKVNLLRNTLRGYRSWDRFISRINFYSIFDGSLPIIIPKKRFLDVQAKLYAHLKKESQRVVDDLERFELLNATIDNFFITEDDENA